MKIQFEKVNCDFCGSKKYTFFAKQKDKFQEVNNTYFEVVKCTNCGLIFTNPRPTKDTISLFYTKKYSFHSNKLFYKLFIRKVLERLARSFYVRIISKFLPISINRLLLNFLKPQINDPVLSFIKKNRKILKRLKFLDIGCGSGLSTNFWGTKSSIIKLSKIINVFGIEPSSDAIKILSDHKIKVFENIDDLENDIKFDIIRLNWSLEHVHSPKKYFKFIEKHLSAIGIAVICVPNINGLLYKINPNALELPIHLFHFDFNSLTNYSRKFNLNTEKLITFSYPGMYLFAEKIGLINRKYNFNKFNLSKGYKFLEFHNILDDIGLGNDILMILKLDNTTKTEQEID